MPAPVMLGVIGAYCDPKYLCTIYPIVSPHWGLMMINYDECQKPAAIQHHKPTI